MNGIIIGYDPGGNGKHGFACLTVKDNKIMTCEIDTLPDVEAVIDRISDGDEPLGIGIDTLTTWSTKKSGWRSADDWLRKQYSDVQGSVISPNALRGAMCLNGMAVMMAVRETWDDVPVTETHPKVLYHVLNGKKKKYDWSNCSRKMCQWLSEQLNCDISPANDHEWDAAISAYAMHQGLLREWKKDLHTEPITEPGERLLRPAGKSFYYWP